MGIIVLGVIAGGAMLLAVLFGQLSKRVPNSDGGLYAYSRHEFGDFAGYLVGWCYLIQAWAGNAAIVSSWVFYVDALFKLPNPSGMENWGIALIRMWVPAAVNLAGVRQMAWFQNVTVVLKFLPLLFVGVVGWFFVTDFISGGGTWTYIVTLAIGLLYLLAGSVSSSPSAFWLHFVGGLLIGVPLLRWWHTTDFHWALISAVALVYVLIAYATRRSSWAVYATIGFFGATIHYLVGSPTSVFGAVASGTTPPHVSPWAPALAFGLLGFWFVLLGLAGSGRRAVAPVVPPPA